MSEPGWLTPGVVTAMHEALLARFGGLPGVPDAGLMESALARPQQLIAHGSPTLFEMAAAYAYGIAKNHPFLDGNKRTAFMSAYTFLGINGQEFDAPETEVVVQTLALAASEISEAEYAAWLEKNSKRVR